VKRAITLLVFLHAGLLVAAEGGELYLFGRDADRLTSDSAEALAIAAAAEEQGEPWAILTWHSQILPLVRYADVFLPPTVAGEGYRRGAFVHLECRPLDDGPTCRSWTRSSELGAYFQLFEGLAPAGQVTVRSQLERPVRIRGTFSDDELVSLVRYIRSGPGPRVPAGRFPSRVSRDIPIQDIEQQSNGSVWVRLTVDGVGGETATVVRTDSGWQVTEVVSWVS